MSNELLVVKMTYLYAMARAWTVKSRTAHRKNQLGATALEWAIISAVLVGVAIIITAVIRQVVNANKTKIDDGVNP